MLPRLAANSFECKWRKGGQEAREMILGVEDRNVTRHGGSVCVRVCACVHRCERAGAGRWVWQEQRQLSQLQPWKQEGVLFYLTLASSPQVCLGICLSLSVSLGLLCSVCSCSAVSVSVSPSASPWVSPSLGPVSLSLHPCVSLSLCLLWTLFTLLPGLISSLPLTTEHLPSSPSAAPSSSAGRGAVSKRADPLGDTGLPVLHASCHIPAAQGQSLQPHCVLAYHTRPPAQALLLYSPPQVGVRRCPEKGAHFRCSDSLTPARDTGSGKWGNSRGDLHPLTPENEPGTQLFPGS